MATVLRRSPLALALVILGLVAGSPGSSATGRNIATSQAFAIKIVVPGQSGALTGYVAAPKDSVGFGAGFSYPDDGSVLTSGAVTSSASADPSQTATAAASAEVTTLSLFGGEVTVAKITAKVRASAGAAGSTGDFVGTEVTGVDGSAVTGNTLGTWGTLSIGSGVGGPADTEARRVWHGSVTAFQLTLTADHGGLPAGSQIIVGYAETNVDAAAAPPATTTPVPTPAVPPVGNGAKANSNLPKPPEPGVLPRKSIDKIPDVHPKLTAGGYVFPVYGPSSFSDTFGGLRGDIVSGWHHGDDIFAPLGAPILSVASGTVFSVGWNKVGGNRLWLRDGQGNLFYYAHLSAFSPLSVNGNKVNAGDVVGFVGNTGDAQGTPYHLHFEIHPVGLLGLGYDGAVNPTSYLLAWKHLQDVSFAGGDAWAPQQSIGNAPKPGAILLAATDISIADGLVPGSLLRAIRPLRRGADGYVTKTGP